MLWDEITARDVRFLDRREGYSSTKSSGDVKMLLVIPLSLSQKDGDMKSGW